MFTSKNKYPLILFVILCISFMGYLIISNGKTDKENLSRQFDGIVEGVRYDEKYIPYVQIKGKEYYLDAGYNFERKIEKGDSIVKSSGSNSYKLIKPTGEVLIFKN
jgi:hypothetical protein